MLQVTVSIASVGNPGLPAELVDLVNDRVLGSGSAVWDGFDEAQITFEVDQEALNPDGGRLSGRDRVWK